MDIDDLLKMVVHELIEAKHEGDTAKSRELFLILSYINKKKASLEAGG